MKRNKKAFLTIAALAMAAMVALAGCPNDDSTSDPVKHKVTFNANGGTIGTADTAVVEVESGKTAALPANPTKTSGDTNFWGWYANANNSTGTWGNKFDSTTPVTADITVYARWGNIAPPPVFTITFDPDGGKVYPEVITVYTGESINPLPTATKSGNAFGGWYEGKNGAGAEFATTTPVTANKTVYAKWTATSSGGGGGSIVGKWKIDSQEENHTMTFSATEVTVHFMGDASLPYTLTGTALVLEGKYTGTAAVTATTLAISGLPEDRSFLNATWIRQ